MNIPHNTSDNLYFLSGGGEMGKLIRETDWSKTPLGDPKSWPATLRTMVAVILDNPFGMYIAWGSEYIQIYNDGYRPILGATKHPKALGLSTRETFAEIWYIIDSMFDGVMKGIPVGFPDFMLPLSRNGFIEECYFDFSYSPIRLENGKVGGILVTVIETTNKKRAENALRESEERFRAMADNIPNLAWMAESDGSIFWYNQKWYEYTGTVPEQMLGWGWQSVHHPQMLPTALSNWRKSIDSGEPFEMTLPLKSKDGTYRQFLTRCLPLKNSSDEIYQWFGTNTDITEQIESEKAIKESEQRFRTMAEGTDLLIAVGDETGNAIYFNNAWVDFTGRDIQSLLKFGWADLIHPDDRDAYVNIYLKAFKNRKPFTGEFRILNNEGQYRWLLANGPPRFNPDGSFAGFISSCIDITERKLAESSLQESEQNLKNTILKAPVAMCIFKGEKHIVSLANERMFELWGKIAEEVMNKPIFEGLPEAKAQGFEALLDGVYNTGESFSAQNVPITLPRSGRIKNVFVDFLYAPYREIDGSITGVLAVAIEVTAQVEARKVLQDGYERFRTLSQAMPQIVWTAAPDGNLDYFNHQWRHYSGLTFEQSVGQGWATTIHPDDLEELSKQWSISLQTGEPYQVEARVKRADNIYRWFLIRALAIKENGIVVQWVGTCTDLEDQKNSEKELQKLSYELAVVNEELKSSNEELAERNSQLVVTNSDLDNFIYTASHDLKAPILNIEGLMINLDECLPEEIRKNEDVEYILELINKSVERFKKTINQLTDITRLQEEIVSGVATKVSLKNVIDDVLLDLQILIQQSSAEIKIDEEICLSLHFSYKNLRSIVYNLISNAIKYRSKERRPEVRISCKEKDKFLVLSVSDNGLGIDLSNESKLFAMFGRLHDHVEGSGVGLYIVKKMVDNAGGKIEVESTIGIGSTFRVYFVNKI